MVVNEGDAVAYTTSELANPEDKTPNRWAFDPVPWMYVVSDNHTLENGTITMPRRNRTNSKRGAGTTVESDCLPRQDIVAVRYPYRGLAGK